MRTTAGCCVLIGILPFASAFAGAPSPGSVAQAALDWSALLLSQAATAPPQKAPPAQNPGQKPDKQDLTPRGEPGAPAEKPTGAPLYAHRGACTFFNVCEAYSPYQKGAWEFGVNALYSTLRAEKHDSFGLQQYIDYGITDDMYVELLVDEPMGYSGEGVGELRLLLFNTFWREREILPAFGGWTQLRIPTGYGSSNVDGVFTGMLTKTLCSKFRAHFQGQVTTASGAQGQNDVVDRRPFQWSVGPGFDYQFSENFLVLLNYLQKSSDYHGSSTASGHNNNIMEAGFVYAFPKKGRFQHYIRTAFDWTLDGQVTTPNFAAKLEWAVDW